MNRIEFLANLDKYKGEDHSTFLQHYGILGQKWGQRRWQNPDGTFNEEGKQRYFGKSSKDSSEDEKVSGLFSKKKKNENINKNIKKETTVDKLNKMLEEKAKRKEKYKHAYDYIQEKNENGKYEDEYGEYDDPDFDSENEKMGGLFNKNLSEEKKDKLREKLYSRDSEMLTINKLYNEDEQKYLLNKKVSKKVNKLVDCLTKGDFEEYNKILEDIDSEHLQTVKNAAQDLANTKQLRNIDTSRLTELSKDIFGNDHILGVQGILAMTNSDDINAHSANRVYPVDVRQSIINNMSHLKNAILAREANRDQSYEREIEIASGGDERRAKYMKQFVNDVEAIKEYAKDSKEINNEIRKLKTKESCDDKAFINYHYTAALYDNMRKYIDDDFPTRLKKGTNDAKKVANNLYKNFEKYSKEFKEDLYYQLLDYYDDDYISKSEFMKEIGKINAVEMYGNGNVSFTYTVPGEMGYDAVSINGNINDNGKLTINDADFID